MTEVTGAVRTVSFCGESYTLAGKLPVKGEIASDFRLYAWINATRVEFTLQAFLVNEMPILLSVVHSLDTPISRLQLKKFDLSMRDFFGLAIGIQISSDLPFTINRVFANEEINSLIGCSDYYDRNFGESYGVLVEEPAILTRAVFVIDQLGVVQYVEVVPEVTYEPDYEAALSVLASLIPHLPIESTENPIDLE